MKKGISKKIAPGFLRLVSVLFLIFEKRDKEKNSARFFKICKYTFLIFEKGDKQKIVSGFLRFVSMLFNLIICFSAKRGYRDVWGLYVWFL